MNHGCSVLRVLPLVAFLSLAVSPPEVGAQADFIRGDSTANGVHDITDATNTLQVLFLGTGIMPCEDAADSDDNGAVELVDVLVGVFSLFGGLIMPPPTVCGSDPSGDNLTCDFNPFCGDAVLTESQRVGHLLNRLAYGPTVADVEAVTTMGIDTYIQQQLDPASIPENPDLLAQLDDLTVEFLPAKETQLIYGQSGWRYFKGTVAPPADWNEIDFDDASWLVGQASFGYGDDDDATRLDDMEGQGGYLTVFLRQDFLVDDPSVVDELTLRVRYDDGFVAYINGFEVERANVVSTAHNASATGNGHEAEAEYEPFDITSHKNRLVAGTNVLAVQLHNREIDSSDASIDPMLTMRSITSQTPVSQYPSIESVKASAHLRGVYSTRRLQIVLADFWENHFTTDFDKVRDYLFEVVKNTDGSQAMSLEQAAREAAQLEALEYEFFLDNALGNFGDMLEFSAKSPTMLIYLDSVLNLKGNANENYSREILELHSYGVDNGYNQTDIEVAARFFTGWNICKVSEEDAGDPLAPCGSTFIDTEVLGLGPGWKYFEGTTEPAPDSSGALEVVCDVSNPCVADEVPNQLVPVPTTGWTELYFDDSQWVGGASSPIGYDTNGDYQISTQLPNMRRNYKAVYLRRSFTLTADDIANLKNLLLEVQYDDGFVAYINGFEAARSASMVDEGTPPCFEADPDDPIEEGIVEVFNLDRILGLLRVGTNVLSAQVHNNACDSSDLLFRPRLLNREVLPGGVENGDDEGVWDFQLVTDQHDSGSKLLFSGRNYQLFLASHAAGDGVAALAESDDLFETLVNAAPTAEFICTKLVRKLVDDSAPPDIVAEAIAAWNSTNPKGNIRTVVEAILTSNEFFNPLYYRSKIKDPLEFVNSSARALDAVTDGFEVITPMDRMGMEIFTRAEPDGWSELGVDWVAAGGMLERILFVQDLSGSGNDDPDLAWITTIFLNDNGLVSSNEIVDFFNDLLFEGTLPVAEVDMLLEYLETNLFSAPQTLVPGTTDYRVRVERVVALMLALPQWNTQ